MQHIIFDLDGTLWNTADSYLYAYEQLCNLFPHSFKRTKEDILKLLGIPLEGVISLLEEFQVSKEVLASHALTFSIEYIRLHPQYYIENLFSFFETLSKNYKISILSNCPKAYMQTFLELTNVQEFIYRSKTIEDGSKEKHLESITNGYREKAIFIGDDFLDYEAIKDHRFVIFCFASYGYKEALCYDYKLPSLDKFNDVLKKIIKKEKMLKGNSFEVISSKDSNCTVIYKKEITYFGFLNLSHNENDHILIRKLKTLGKTLIGPINGNTWYPYRISLTNFDFHLYPDCINDPYVLKLFLECGFEIDAKYTSTLASINTKIWERGRKISLHSNYEIKVVHQKECFAYLDALYEVAVVSFEKGLFYEPISKEDFKELYLENIRLVSPDLILIYYKKQLVAFNFCYEDLEKRFYVCKTIGILPKHRSMKVILKLIDASYKVMTSYGYKEVLYHFQNDQTKGLYPIFKNHVIQQKYFGLLRYTYEE